RFGLDERLLHRMEPIAFGQCFDRHHRLVADGGEPRHTRSGDLIVDENRAGAAVAFTAPELGSSEPELVAEDREQVVAWLPLHLMRAPVDAKRVGGHGTLCWKNPCPSPAAGFPLPARPMYSAERIADSGQRPDSEKAYLLAAFSVSAF